MNIAVFLIRSRYYMLLPLLMGAAARRNIVLGCHRPPLRGHHHSIAFVARVASSSNNAAHIPRPPLTLTRLHSSSSSSSSSSYSPHPGGGDGSRGSTVLAVAAASSTEGQPSNNTAKQYLFANGSVASTHSWNESLTSSTTQTLSLPSPFTSKVQNNVDERIQKLLSHPAMTWNSTTSFASMHKKKLGVRHLPLFDNYYNPAAAGDPRAPPPATIASTQQQRPSPRRREEDELFHQFASAICHANNAIPRKELFETWSAALHIYNSFFGDDAPRMTSTTTTRARNDDDDDDDDGEWNGVLVPIRRVVDVAAGHGLLAWALLLLDEEYYHRGENRMRRHPPPPPPLTAFCLDLHMPPSATAIHSSMTRRFSHLASRFDYVEGRLEQLVPHPSCLLASVHGCGILTDMLVAAAAEHKVPLAVVPCCHSRKSIVMEVASPYAKDQYDDILRNDGGRVKRSSIPDLADRLDGARKAALTNAGLRVKEAYLPKMFTDKNRLIMGFPSTDSASSTTKKAEGECQPIVKTTFTTWGNGMPPLDNHHSDAIGILRPKSRYMKGFYIPCQDSRFHRQLITQFSGKNAANTRKKVMHNRNHTRCPQLDVSLWLPPDDDDETDGIVSETSLSSLIDGMNEGVQCTVTKVGEVYTHPSSGRKAQTFRIQYGVLGSSSNNFNDGEDEENLSLDTSHVLPFEDAKRIHLQFCESIPVAFPGAECR